MEDQVRQKYSYHRRQNIWIIALLPQEHVARRIAVIKDKLVSQRQRVQYYCGDMSSECIDLTCDIEQPRIQVTSYQEIKYEVYLEFYSRLGSRYLYDIFSDTSILFCIEANSLEFTTEKVLSQMFINNSKWHPVIYFKKSLSSVKYNYKIYNKKILAII